MDNERIETTNSIEDTDTSVDYISALNEMRANTVSKDEYTKLRSENKKLLEAIVSGEKIDIPKEERIDVSELRKELFNRDGNLTNLDYVDKSLKLRKALIERGERDPFLPCGTHVSPTGEMYDKAEAVAELLQECVDYADGDSGLFTARYQSLVKDPTMYRGRR